MGIVSDTNASYKLLSNALTALGYSMSEKMVQDHLYVTYRSPAGHDWMTRAAHLRYPFTAEKVSVLAIDKAEASEFAEKKGVSAPDTLKVVKGTIDSAAVEAFVETHGRVVVKPLDRSLSMGLTTDVTTTPKALSAIKKAMRFSDAVLVQEQVFGEEIRFAVIDGTVVSALLRRTPRVVGDGVSTIAQLLEAENAKRREIDYSLTPYPQLTDDLIARRLDRNKIPAAGEVIELSRATMISKGCSVYDVLEELHASYIDIVESLVSDLDTEFIVVDLFVRDFHTPATEDNYWFIEFNTAPVLKLFYSCRDGNMHDILPTLAASIDKKIHAASFTETVGSFEPVSFPGLGIKGSIAKIDTGAYSGAIGCSEIKVVKRAGARYLRFSPGRRSKKVLETEHFSEKYVRSSNGQRQKRYLIETEMTVRNRTYPITISLSNRSEMKYEILIGRKFLRQNNFLVDVRLNQEYDTDREAK